MPRKPAKRKQVHPASRPAKKYIFWASDEYPYVFGAVGWLEDNGFARIPKSGMYVQPIRVVDDIKEGEALAAMLGRLKREKETALRLTDEGFEARRRQIAAWVPKPRKKPVNQVTPYPVSRPFNT